MYQKYFLAVLLILIFSISVIIARPNTAELQRLSAKFEAEYEIEKTEANRVAKENGWIIKAVFPSGKIMELQKLAVNGMPMYYITNNLNAARTVGVDKLWPGGSSGFNLTGSGTTLGEWDAGGVRLSHQEFEGRVTQIDNPDSIHKHATHVAGTMIAAGIDANAKGMSYQANLNAYKWDSDESEMATAAAGGLIISNHSYSYKHGWEYTDILDEGEMHWYWVGDINISTTEDYKFGFYDYNAQSWDEIAYNAPDYLICKSAGNERDDSHSGGHYVFDGFWTWSTDPRDPDGGSTGYDSIGRIASAKNIMTVGAVNDISGGYTNPGDVVMSSFSCWGPCDDGRIKPDICGNGISLYSTDIDSDTDYYTASGTSMSSPNVAGALGLIQSYYHSLNGSYMNAASLKGLVINTAHEAGSSDGPDYKFGWGLLNSEGACNLVTEDNTFGHLINEYTLNDGSTNDYYYFVDTGITELNVTICWTDPAGTPINPSLDPTDKMLVNDLDLRITGGTTTYYPWKLDVVNPSYAATNSGDNDADNVEKVTVSNPESGTYIVSVSHKGTLVNPQDYSLIVDGAVRLPTVEVCVNSNAQAEGYVNVLDEFNTIIATTGWDTEFQEGDNYFSFDLTESYDLSLLSGNAGAGTSWGEWAELTEQGFYGEPLTCNLYFNFTTPPDVSVFLRTNSDVEEGTVVIHYLPEFADTITMKWDNDDLDNDGLTEVRFEDVSLPYGFSHHFLQVTATGTNVYGETIELEANDGFEWNNNQWENHELETENIFWYTLPTMETKIFYKGWNWLSFPWMFRDGNDGFIVEIVIDDLEPCLVWIEAENPDVNFMEWMPGWAPPGWQHNSEFEDFVSTNGYKIKMNDDYSWASLFTYGSRLDENTPMYLEGNGEENWVGYYPINSQRPSEAFAQIWDDNLYQIKAKDWTMYKHNGEWQGSGMRYTLNYGEMYIIKLRYDCPDFQWNNSAGTGSENRDKAEYFTYEEKSDYIPIFVEFEEGEEPLEIGIKVEGECKGAAKVEDSSVQVNAYILEGQGEEVEFEMYYGREQPEVKPKDYYVYDPITDIKEKKKIRTGEYRDFYRVYFNDKIDIDQNSNDILEIHHSPNPFFTSTNISYNLPEEIEISLEVYNIKGQKIKTLYNGFATAGEHQVSWNGINESNQQVSSGIYFYKLITPQKVITNKMLLMR